MKILQPNLKTVSKLLISLPLGFYLMGLANSSTAAEPPSKQFIQKDIPIVLILEEWYKKSPSITSYACVCTKGTCDSSNRWPFRKFSMGGVIPALGAYNKADAERIGFTCGQIDPRGLRGI